MLLMRLRADAVMARPIASTPQNALVDVGKKITSIPSLPFSDIVCVRSNKKHLGMPRIILIESLLVPKSQKDVPEPRMRGGNRASMSMDVYVVPLIVFTKRSINLVDILLVKLHTVDLMDAAPSRRE